MQTKILIIPGMFFLLLLAASTASSQPYYFLVNNPGGSLARISRLNLATGAMNQFIPDEIPGIVGVSWDEQQRWVYLLTAGGSGQGYLVDSRDSTVRNPFPPQNDAGAVDGIVYSPRQNKFYVAWDTSSSGDSTQIGMGSIYDGKTLNKVDTLAYGGLTFNNILSQRGDSITVINGDRNSQNWSLDIFSTANNTVIKSKGVGGFAPVAALKYPMDVEGGFFLYGYYYPDSLSGQVVTYNALTDSSYPPVHCLVMINNAVLSSDARYAAVLENDQAGVSTGTIYVFTTATGKLKQKWYFPLGGQMLVYDTPADTIYYLTPQSQVYKIALSAPPTPVKDLLDTLATMTPAVADQGLLGDDDFGDQLDSMLATARSALASGDSIGCARSVKTYRDSVRYYLLNPTSEKFVLRDGDAELFSNAQYILDALPPLR